MGRDEASWFGSFWSCFWFNGVNFLMTYYYWLLLLMFDRLIYYSYDIVSNQDDVDYNGLAYIYGICKNS